jgi:hypothetical protein
MMHSAIVDMHVTFHLFLMLRNNEVHSTQRAAQASIHVLEEARVLGRELVLGRGAT